MEFLVYKKATGKLEAVYNVAGVEDPTTLLKTIYGEVGPSLFDCNEWEGDFPKGKKMIEKKLEDDPSYILPKVVPTTEVV